jgi:hypothetical protein
MKHRRTFTWMFLLIVTSALTGVQQRLDAEVNPSLETPVQPMPELLAAPEGADGCGAEVVSATDRVVAGPRPYSPEVASFAVRFKDEASPYRVMSLFALPGEEVAIEAVPGEGGGELTACARGGELRRRDLARSDGDGWTWRAPSRPGLYSLYVDDRSAGETLKLNAFVMKPYRGEDRVNDYRIGRYERVPLHGKAVYRVPRGMVEVTPDMLDVWLSPHFQLHQFLCKQASQYPKYLILSERLLLKLETLLEKANDRGIEADSFAVMSGFRTPHYNQSIGNRTSYSRHLYGDAADIYVDRDGDGRMDDLNGDGRSDAADAELLARIVEESQDEAWYRPFIGGLGLYGPAPHRGPFIHVDTRGFPARWSS